MASFPDIEIVIPHRAPIRMVDAIETQHERSITCAALLRSDNAYACGDEIPGLVNLELFAQTAAALFGYRAWLTNLPFALGAIVGVQRLNTTRSLRVGERALIHVEERFTVDQLTHARGKTTIDGEVVADAALTVLTGAPEDVTFRPQHQR